MLEKVSIQRNKVLEKVSFEHIILLLLETIMLKRKIQKWLNNFTISDHKVLFVDGARQVGKTYILQKYQEQVYKNNTYINIATNKESFNILRKSKNAEDFYTRLSIITDKIGKESSSIFIDEIQLFYDPICKAKDTNDNQIFDLITMSKDLAIKYKDKFIFSGSLLGFVANNVISFPEGYALSYTMHPLDFEEFLWANNISSNIIEKLRDAFLNKTRIEDYIHSKILALFHVYVLVGGMPNAVNKYVTTKNLNEVAIAHKSIEDYIKHDIAYYAPVAQKVKIREIYDLIPSELNAKSKRFSIADIESSFHGEDLTSSFQWIKTSGAAIAVYNVTEPVIPLLASKKRNLMKVYLEDVGILTYLYFNSLQKASLLNGELKANFGAIYENVAAQLLKAHGFSNIYYYNSKKYGEVDFLIEKDNKIIPIEIRSGKDYHIHHAMNNLIKIEEYNIDEGFVFGETNIEQNGKVTYFPIYLLDFLSKNNHQE